MASDENNPVWKPALFSFARTLAELGWSEGENVRMDLRWGGADNNRRRALAQALVGLQPDIILFQLDFGKGRRAAMDCQNHDLLGRDCCVGSAQGRCSTVARSVPWVLLLHEPWGHGP